MKRNIITLLLAIFAALALAAPAWADMIWEPEDSFYKSHREECSYLSRPYLLAGYDGTVTLYTAPGGMGKATLENDTQAIVQGTWEGDGIAWGYLMVNGGQEGWAPMDDLTPVYDCQQFLSDYSAQIAIVDPVEVDFYEAVLYNYPNGTTYGDTLQEDTDYQPFDQTFTQIYTDGSGLRWGYVGYYMGRIDGWICLDDPMNDSLTGGIVPSAPSPAQLRGSATIKPGVFGSSVLLTAAVLVAVVVVVTGILVLKLKKRETKQPNGEHSE